MSHDTGSETLHIPLPPHLTGYTTTPERKPVNTTPLHDQLAAIERELAALDFDGARQRIKSAETYLARLPTGTVGHFSDDNELQARGRVKHAKGALASLEARAVELRRKADGITRLLTAGQRVEQAQADVQHAQQAADTSAAKLADAEATARRLDDLIAAEQRASQADIEADAARLLEAARTGAKAGAVATRQDRLAPLRVAKASAEHEHALAKTRHEADRAAIAAAQRRVHEAEADVSEGEYQAAEAAFIAVAAQHVAALTRSGHPVPGFTHLHGKVFAAVQALEASPS